MSKKPRVCFLATVFNGQNYIAETIGSISNQTLKDIEIIYVDDGSTDATWEILEAIKKNEPRLRTYRLATNKGIAKAWNYGLKFVKAPIICISSADDVYIEERAELSYKALHKRPYDAYYGAYLRGNENLKIQEGFLIDGSPAWIGETVPYKKGCLDKKQTIPHGFMSITTKMHKKVLLREHLKVGIDYPFMKDLEAAGCRFCWTKEPLGIYRLHKKSVSYTRYKEVQEATNEAKRIR